MPDFLTTAQGRKIAHHRTPGSGPGVVFLGGFRSDMGGTKAVFLQDWAKRTGRAFLRFDYSGHGDSSGDFLDGSVGDWAEDAFAAITALTEGPQILVGSSMGGWIALLLARRMPLAALIGIAAAPDFTEDAIWARFSDAERQQMTATGLVLQPSDYGAPCPITRRLIEDGRRQLILRSSLSLAMPVRLLQGSADRDVPPSVALRLFDHAQGPDIRLTLVKGADHRFSTPECLDLMVETVERLLAEP